MKIINIIKYLLSKKRNIKPSNDDYFDFELVYASRASFMFLVKYSQSKSNQIIEFLDSCSKNDDVITYAFTVSNNIDAEKDGGDFRILPEVDYIDTNYLFVSCNVFTIADLFLNCQNLSNQVLYYIRNSLYEIYDRSIFADYMKFGIFEDSFSDNIPSAGLLVDKDNQVLIDDPKVIYMVTNKLIPKNILYKFIRIFSIKQKHVSRCDFTELANNLSSGYEGYDLKNIEDALLFLFNTVNSDVIFERDEIPMCLIDLSNDQDSDDEYTAQIDDDFKIRYNIFNPISTTEEQIRYEDISEIITSEEENEDMFSND